MPPTDARNPPRARPFQFSLRTMFIVTTVAAVALGGLCTPIAGVQAATLLYLSILVPAALTVTVIYGRGYVRTFAIGALFPAGLAFLCALIYAIGDEVFDADKWVTSQEPSPAMVLTAAVVLVLVLLAGLVAVGIRRMVESAQRTPPPASPPQGTMEQLPPKDEDRANA